MMMKDKSIAQQAKQEIVENLLNSRALKILKYSAIGLGGVYALGFIFKVFAFTNTNLNKLRRSIKS